MQSLWWGVLDLWRRHHVWDYSLSNVKCVHSRPLHYSEECVVSRAVLVAECAQVAFIRDSVPLIAGRGRTWTTVLERSQELRWRAGVTGRLEYQAET